MFLRSLVFEFMFDSNFVVEHPAAVFYLIDGYKTSTAIITGEAGFGFVG